MDVNTQLISTCICGLCYYPFSPLKAFISVLMHGAIQVMKQDLADSYEPPFKSCVEQGKASSLMCAYNLVNGIPNCANFDLLTTTAREHWGFQG